MSVRARSHTASLLRRRTQRAGRDPSKQEVGDLLSAEPLPDATWAVTRQSLTERLRPAHVWSPLTTAAAPAVHGGPKVDHVAAAAVTEQQQQ